MSTKWIPYRGITALPNVFKCSQWRIEQQELSSSYVEQVNRIYAPLESQNSPAFGLGSHWLVL